MRSLRFKSVIRLLTFCGVGSSTSPPTKNSPDQYQSPTPEHQPHATGDANQAHVQSSANDTSRVHAPSTLELDQQYQYPATASDQSNHRVAHGVRGPHSGSDGGSH